MNNLKVVSLTPGALVTLLDDQSTKLYRLLSVVHSCSDTCVVSGVTSGNVQLRPQHLLHFEAMPCAGGYCIATGEVISRERLRERFAISDH